MSNTAGNRYVIANSWMHIFEGIGERQCRFAFDSANNKMVGMEMCVGNKWERATAVQTADVRDSLINANGDALDNPETLGLEASGELPSWASPTSAFFTGQSAAADSAHDYDDGHFILYRSRGLPRLIPTRFGETHESAASPVIWDKTFFVSPQYADLIPNTNQSLDSDARQVKMSDENFICAVHINKAARVQIDFLLSNEINTGYGIRIELSKEDIAAIKLASTSAQQLTRQDLTLSIGALSQWLAGGIDKPASFDQVEVVAGRSGNVKFVVKMRDLDTNEVVHGKVVTIDKNDFQNLFGPVPRIGFALGEMLNAGNSMGWQDTAEHKEGARIMKLAAQAGKPLHEQLAHGYTVVPVTQKPAAPSPRMR